METSLQDLSSSTPAAARIVTALAFLLVSVSLTSGAAAQETTEEAHQKHEQHRTAGPGPGGPALEEPGNAAFAAIREIVVELNRREDTDWADVDLEAVRQHLRDMRRFTLEAEIVARDSIEGGLRVAVRGSGREATEAIRRALHAHGPMLEEETGWSVEVTDRGKRTVLRVTGASRSEAAKIRGLGYIGLMATGSHHQRHHWMIATGRSPHRP